MEVTGREHVPKTGPLIIVANHMSYNDSLALAVAIPRLLDFLGKKEFFRSWPGRFVMKRGRVHPVTRSNPSVGELRKLMQLLNEGRCLVIFPEGTRSKGPMRRAKPGAARLALTTRVRILPVTVTGTQWPFWRAPFPFCRFGVDIGEPVTVNIGSGESTQDAMDRIMRTIASKLPPKYRGVYGTPYATVQ